MLLSSKLACPHVLGLFQKRIRGDDALLRLAELRFKESGLGMECYAESAAELDKLLTFRYSPETTATVHMERNINLLDPAGRRIIYEFAAHFAGRLYGMIIHDQPEMETHRDDYLIAVHKVAARLNSIPNAPYLFIEYASGLWPGSYVDFFRKIHDIGHISACIDIGHLGLWQVGHVYSAKHHGESIFALKFNPARQQEVIADIQDASHAGLGAVLHVVHDIARLGKQFHFHLHDGHPLSTFSPYGISDHLSFFQKIPIPFIYMGEKSLAPMFGPEGLGKIVREAIVPGCSVPSFTLEIHPTEGNLSLENSIHLFDHWKDKHNAERMNFWLSVLLSNHQLIIDSLKKETS